MASPNNQTIPIIVKSTDHGYNCAYVITQGDANAYTLTITYSDIEAFDGTVLLRFVMPDGTYHDRDDSDGVTVDGNVITYLMAEADYAQRGMVCYVRHLDSTTLHTTLKVTFSQIRALEGEVAGTETVSYPTWAADMRDLDFAIGTVETLDPGADATASITGDVPDKVLNLGIPQGATGAQGPQGDVGPNTVSTATATDLTGVIAGDGANIRAATAADGDSLPVTGGTLGASLAAKANYPTNVKLVLPNSYSLVEGDVFELFWDNIVLSSNPNQYYIEAFCTKGKNYLRKYIYAPEVGDAGIYVLSINLYSDDRYLIDSKEVSLIVYAKPTSPFTTVGLIVGDSLLADGEAVTELFRRLTQAAGSPAGDEFANITFIGSIDGSIAGAKCEAYGGWTFTDYNGASSPFWNAGTGAIDFDAYVTAQGESTLDIVYVLLGWNNVGASEIGYKAAANTFINNVLSDFPNCKIVLIGLQMPSADGLGENYGCSSVYYYHKCKEHVFLLDKWYAEIAVDNPNVNFISLCGQFDTEFNMPTATRAVNARNTDTETYGTNGVHPSGDGSMQIADAMYRKFVAQISEFNLIRIPDYQPGDATVGKYIDGATGNLVVNASWCATDYLEVVPGETYNIGGISTYGTAPGFAWYAVDKTYISGAKHNNVNYSPITAPANAYYLRDSIWFANINDYTITPV